MLHVATKRLAETLWKTRLFVQSNEKRLSSQKSGWCGVLVCNIHTRHFNHSSFAEINGVFYALLTGVRAPPLDGTSLCRSRYATSSHSARKCISMSTTGTTPRHHALCQEGEITGVRRRGLRMASLVLNSSCEPWPQEMKEHRSAAGPPAVFSGECGVQTRFSPDPTNAQELRGLGRAAGTSLEIVKQCLKRLHGISQLSELAEILRRVSGASQCRRQLGVSSCRKDPKDHTEPEIARAAKR